MRIFRSVVGWGLAGACAVLAGCSAGQEPASKDGAPGPAFRDAQPVASGVEAPNIDSLGRAQLIASAKEEHVLLPSSKDTRLVLNSLPDAACRLVGEEEKGGNSIDVMTDGDGVVELGFSTDQLGSAGHLLMTCQDANGQVETRRVSIETQAGAPEPTPRKMTGVLRPPLAGDPTLPTQAELLAQSYPPRPDQGTPAYDRWLENVTTPVTLITPRLVDVPGRYNAASSPNWSGYVTGVGTSHSGVYYYADSDWYVQRYGGTSGTMSMWVGLDGWGNSDIIQDGVGTTSTVILGLHLLSSQSWIEYFPEAQVNVSNFPVSAGQHVYFAAWSCNSDGTISFSGPVGCFYMYNYDTTAGGFISRNKPSGTTFHGASAEWILERPTIGGKLATLPDYAAQTIFNPYTYETSLGMIRMHDAPGKFAVWMYSGSTLISSSLDADDLGGGDYISFVRH